MYSSSSLSNHLSYQQLSDESEVNLVSSNINSNRIIHETSSSNEATNHIYTNGGSLQSVNSYLQSDMLHHHGQPLQGLKKLLDTNYLQSKDQLHIYEGEDATSGTIITASVMQSQSQQSSLPLLTPLKYVEYHSIVNEEQMINDDSDKSDCESGEHELHKIPSKLPHKKRIAKNLNANQPFNSQEQFSIIMPAEESNLRNMQTTNPHFECNICGIGILDQLQFFIHLKQHYEPTMYSSSRKANESECEPENNLMMDHQQHHDVVTTLPEKLIESLEDSQQAIKNEEIPRETLPEIDEFNEFSEPEDMMEDLRKEVEKVVETINDNECLPESTWNYQVPDEIEENEGQSEELQLYSDNLNQNNPESSMGSNYEDIENADEIQQENIVDHNTDTRNYDSEDEDDITLEQVRQSIQKSIKVAGEPRKFHVEDDKEDIELTECLKKIHNFKCTSCNKAFNSRTALGYHLKTHTTERRYVCDQCGKKFLTNGALKVHQRLHTDDRPYECKFPDCGKSFRQWGDLKYHETSIHSNKKDHVCEFCAKAFARKYSLVIHRRIHTGERNYKCTDCDKSFRASSYLLNHKRIHTGEKPYTCTVMSCQKKFRVVGDLKRHMKIHERTKISASKEKKKEVTLPNVKKEKPLPVIVNTIENLAVNDECVDLSLKDQDKSSLVYSNNGVDIYTKNGRATAANEKEDASPRKGRKSNKSRKLK